MTTLETSKHSSEPRFLPYKQLARNISLPNIVRKILGQGFNLLFQDHASINIGVSIQWIGRLTSPVPFARARLEQGAVPNCTCERQERKDSRGGASSHQAPEDRHFPQNPSLKISNRYVQYLCVCRGVLRWFPEAYLRVGQTSSSFLGGTKRRTQTKATKY